MDDIEMAAASAKGDQDAFAMLFARYRQLVYRVAYKIMLNEEDALDVTQDVFLRLSRKIGDYSGRGTFRGWIAVIAANEALSHLRRPCRRERATDPQDLDTSHVRASARDHVELHKKRDLIRKAMENLSPQQRAILMLQCEEDIGPLEIANRLGVPASQVRVQLRRAILSLRDMIFSKSKDGGRT